MAKFEIIGGNKLSGKIKVAGNKNSVLPIMAACLLTDKTCILENVPKISDVQIMAKLLEKCGAKVKGVGTDKLEISAQNIHPAAVPTMLTEKLRASVLLLGPMLVRVGKLKLGYPGGDVIGRRPLDTHIQALTFLGADIRQVNDYFEATAAGIKGAEIFLEEASVTATENVIMMAVLADGQTVIKEDLDMILLTLEKFGVNFSLQGNKLVVSDGKLEAVEKVATDVWPGFPTDLMAPMIVLATQAKGATILHDWMYESRMFFVDKLLSMGAKVEIADPHRVLVYGPSKLRGQKLDTPDIRAGIALVIAALSAEGSSLIDKAELIERGYENIVKRLTSLGAVIKKVS